MPPQQHVQQAPPQAAVEKKEEPAQAAPAKAEPEEDPRKHTSADQL